MIKYNYEVIRKDETNKVIDVKYTAEGLQEYIVGMTIPTIDENFEEKIQQSAPMGLWLQSKVTYQDIPIGMSGTLPNTTSQGLDQHTALSEEEKQRMENIQMWADIDFERRVGEALVKFNILKANPTEIPVTKL